MADEIGWTTTFHFELMSDSSMKKDFKASENSITCMQFVTFTDS